MPFQFIVGVIPLKNGFTQQFGIQVESPGSCDHNSQAAANAFSVPWYFSEVELEL